MKMYLLHAALKQGMDKSTVVSALTDGTHNYWSVIFSLKSHCQRLIHILDWFHIGQKFQHVRSVVDERCEETLDRVK